MDAQSLSTARALGQFKENMMYIGTKLINAEPMTRAAYNSFRGWELPANENGADEGYLVEYQDGGKPNVVGRAGYVSWSPKEQFDAAYRPINAMTFGLAIEALKLGKKVARAGWNGKGIFIELQRPDENSKMTSPYIFIDTTGLQTDNPAAPKSRVPWLASQTDMLAEDWQVVE